MKQPANISTAHPGVGDRLVAPSAARNIDAICDLLQEVAPATGNALELASGTGEHIARLAALMPGLNWQPSDVDATRRASADAYAKDAGLTNLAPAIFLDATAPGWGAKYTGQSLIFLSNLLHLITDAQASTLIAEAASALTRGGRLVIYGPFMRGEKLTSDGDISFHQSLRAQNPDIGYKDDFDVMDLIQDTGLEMREVIEMPANNLSLIAQK
ncbi:MAG: class I SAM-dependent methyltransferase [Rhodobacteraceae bacterium]|nr:class I SAM-dependent methyltransferase [Paracoccaceae bacterium]